MLEAYDATGASVLSQMMPLEAYYEGENDLIDSNQFRKERGIVRVVGTIYDHGGAIAQTFDNEYAPDGELVRGTAHHRDGTVTQSDGSS